MDKQHSFSGQKEKPSKTCIQVLTGHTCITVEAETVRKDSQLGGWQSTAMPTWLCLTRLHQVLWCYDNLVAPVLGQPFIRPSPATDSREHLTLVSSESCSTLMSAVVHRGSISGRFSKALLWLVGCRHQTGRTWAWLRLQLQALNEKITKFLYARSHLKIKFFKAA